MLRANVLAWATLTESLFKLTSAAFVYTPAITFHQLTLHHATLYGFRLVFIVQRLVLVVTVAT